MLSYDLLKHIENGVKSFMAIGENRWNTDIARKWANALCEYAMEFRNSLGEMENKPKEDVIEITAAENIFGGKAI